MQFYNQLSVGSARPNQSELVGFENYMFGTQSIDEPLTAGQFTKKVLNLLKELETRKKLTVIVGGSGFYTYSLITGMYDNPVGDSKLKDSIETELRSEGGAERLLSEIKEKDFETYKKLHVNDHYRIGRAVEILRSSGKKVSELVLAQKKLFPYPFKEFVLQISRPVLLQRITDRTVRILNEGILQEIISVKESLGLDFPALQSVGYKQALFHLQQCGFDVEKIDKTQLHADIVQATMKLAKKQRTWYQRELHGSMLRYDFQDHKGILKTIVDWL